MHSVSDVRQTVGPSHLEVEIAIPELKKYKSPCSDQIPAELIQAGGEMLRSTNSLILFGIRKNCLIDGRVYYCTSSQKWVTKLTVIIIVVYHCYQLHTKLYQISCSQG
jgi:hypothetical protein